MSRTVVSSAGTDVTVRQDAQYTVYAGSPVLQATGGSGAVRSSLLLMPTLAPKGSTVLSAVLSLTQVAALTGSVQVNVQTYTGSWQEATASWHSTGGAASVGGPLSTMTKTAPGAGTVWQMDVTAAVQAAVNGGAFHGFRITSTVTPQVIQFNSMNASQTALRPTLTVTYASQPDTPVNLRPAVAATGVPQPVLSYSFSEPGGNTTIGQQQVQVANDSGFTSIAYDSGVVDAGGDASFDLSTTGFSLTAGTTYYWRVKCSDADGVWSTWSTAVPLLYQPLATPVITSPAPVPNNYVTEYTPPILWTFANQTYYRVYVVNAALPWKVLYDTGKVPGNAQGHSVPLYDPTMAPINVGGGVWEGPVGFDASHDQWIATVQCWDNVTRESTQGLPSSASASIEFSVKYDPTVLPPSNFTARAVDDSPGWVDLSWIRATAPDSWTLERDGKVLIDNFVPGDSSGLTFDGTTYRLRDHHLGGGNHTYTLRAVVNNVKSANPPSATVLSMVEGIWLYDPADPENSLVVVGDQTMQFAQTDMASNYQVQGAYAPVRVVMGLAGLSGTVGPAMLRDRSDTLTNAVMKRRLKQMKARPIDTFRLILGDENIPVLLQDIMAPPHPQTRSDQVLSNVSFGFQQNGEFDFAQVL